MAAASSQSIDIGEQRAELKSVLESAHFVRAPKLALLLSYLCEKLFSGQAASVKEYCIGVEVFGRGEDFDQNTDSIVRVEANRLRKRLAEFYAAEGASHHLRITIPVGQYVPDFEQAVSPASGSRNEIELPPEPPALLSQPIAPEARGLPSVRSRRPRLALLIPAAVLVLSALALSIYYTRSTQNLHRDRATVPQPKSVALGGTDSPFGPPPGDEVRILAGATRSFVDHAGKLWNADTWVTGGAPFKTPAQHIWRTLDPDFYRTFRQGDFRYDIPLKSGVYELRLHFAETTYGPESTGTGGEGSRIMSVRANGSTLLKDFDIAADAGASRTADVKVFPNIQPAADGKLHLEFAGQDGTQAELSAIEITPGVRGQLKPVRILARQSPYYSNDSQWWSPDNYFQGGQIAAYPTPVTGTDDPELYQTERWGNFSYAIPVPPGRYSVWLRFAIRHESSEAGHPVRIFNVFCNGKALLENFNLPGAARESDIVIRKFAGLEPNAQGKLMLSFLPVDGYASLAGIEVLPQQ